MNPTVTNVRKPFAVAPSGPITLQRGLAVFYPAPKAFLRLRYFYLGSVGRSSVLTNRKSAAASYHGALTAFLGHFSVARPSHQAQIFTDLLNFVSAVKSFDGVRSAFLSALYSIRANKQVPLFRRGIDLWKEYRFDEPGVQEVLGGIVFLNCMTKVLTYLGKSALSQLTINGSPANFVQTGATMGTSIVRIGALTYASDAGTSDGGSAPASSTPVQTLNNVCQTVVGSATGTVGGLLSGAAKSYGGLLFGQAGANAVSSAVNQIFGDAPSQICSQMTTIQSDGSNGLQVTLYPDGSAVTTFTGSDGSTTTTSWSAPTTNSDGSQTTSFNSSTTDSQGNVTSSSSGQITTTTNPDGSVTSVSNSTTTNSDGSQSQSQTTTTLNSDGSWSQTTDTTTTDSSGNSSSSSTTTTATNNSDGSQTVTTTNSNSPGSSNGGSEPNGSDSNTGIGPLREQTDTILSGLGVASTIISNELGSFWLGSLPSVDEAGNVASGLLNLRTASVTSDFV